ncbi:sensor histidine kinase [Roseococcus suduntuyensis]|uniref:histidine kinase n=1 Tax=Roseococcus suduntuyensis TaxID=455361 RepID=A0A840AEC8_9PROT|nr:ATP-binding protein [Roseococcus suduntuyensis]MBB3899262.1 signal transduction histidine kinase [Roseococcus suduntuyensis]
MLVSNSPPNRDQKFFALGVIAVLLGAMLLVAPFARNRLEGSEPMVLAYTAAVFTTEMITAALLLSLFAVQRSPAILVLAIAYLYSGFMAVPWALSFPTVLASLGLAEAGQQTTASIAAMRRIGCPLFLLAYAMLRGAREVPAGRLVPALIVGSIAAVAAVVAGVTWIILGNHDLLPRFVDDSRRITHVWMYVPVVALVLYAVLIVLLGLLGRSVLDLCLLVVICALTIDLFLLSFVSAGLQFSVGWWAGRLYSLTAASVILILLLAEAASLSARLARSAAAERRANEDRLVTLQAFSAAVAHEINQPLASMVTNADAGLRWLAREQPDVHEASAALTRIARDGHRAGKVVEGIRTTFSRRGEDHAQLNINQLIRDVLDCYRDECRAAHVVMQTDLDADLPWVPGNRVQIEQVIANLVTNAIDAMRSVTSGERVLLVRSTAMSAGEVIVSVADSGIGLPPEHADRLFQPFFTTKPNGLGVGLTVSRLILDAHGGRLWASENAPRGAVFHFALPCDGSPAALAKEPVR